MEEDDGPWHNADQTVLHGPYVRFREKLFTVLLQSVADDPAQQLRRRDGPVLRRGRAPQRHVTPLALRRAFRTAWPHSGPRTDQLGRDAAERRAMAAYAMFGVGSAVMDMPRIDSVIGDCT